MRVTDDRGIVYDLTPVPGMPLTAPGGVVGYTLREETKIETIKELRRQFNLAKVIIPEIDGDGLPVEGSTMPGSVFLSLGESKALAERLWNAGYVLAKRV